MANSWHGQVPPISLTAPIGGGGGGGGGSQVMILLVTTGMRLAMSHVTQHSKTANMCLSLCMLLQVAQCCFSAQACAACRRHKRAWNIKLFVIQRVSCVNQGPLVPAMVACAGSLPSLPTTCTHPWRRWLARGSAWLSCPACPSSWSWRPTPRRLSRWRQRSAWRPLQRPSLRRARAPCWRLSCR